MLHFKNIIKENSVSHQSASWTEVLWADIFASTSKNKILSLILTFELQI